MNALLALWSVDTTTCPPVDLGRVLFPISDITILHAASLFHPASFTIPVVCTLPALALDWRVPHIVVFALDNGFAEGPQQPILSY